MCSVQHVVSYLISLMWNAYVTFLKRLKAEGFGSENQVSFPTKRKTDLSSTHWIPIPNVKHFRVNINGINKIFKFFGLTKSNPPTIVWEPYRNAKFNIYMCKQIRRLRKYKANPYVFFRIMLFLISRSKIFRVSAINKTMHHWYKKLPLWYVFKVNKQVNDIIQKGGKIQYKRVYIPKGETWRPLGVPTHPWRIYLQLINNFLYIYLEDYFLKSQHGFIPGRGTLTAWREVFTKVPKYKFVYEFDLKKCFDLIDTRVIADILMRLGVPSVLAYHLEEINTSQPDLPEDRKLDESKADKVKYYQKLKEESYHYSYHDDMVNGYWNQYNIEESYQGVPQGSNTGPLLAIVALKKFLSQQESISYADDGLFMSNEDFSVKEMPLSGIHINWEKSGWVRRNGVWIKPLKFLGLEWDGQSLKAATRTGSRLLADDTRSAWSILTDTFVYKRKVPNYNHTWEYIFKGSLAGQLQSKLYNGTWNLEEIVTSKRFNVCPNSILGRVPKHLTIDLYNASSLASYSLIKLLTKKERRPSNRM